MAEEKNQPELLRGWNNDSPVIKVSEDDQQKILEEVEMKETTASAHYVHMAKSLLSDLKNYADVESVGEESPAVESEQPKDYVKMANSMLNELQNYSDVESEVDVEQNRQMINSRAPAETDDSLLRGWNNSSEPTKNSDQINDEIAGYEKALSKKGKEGPKETDKVMVETVDKVNKSSEINGSTVSGLNNPVHAVEECKPAKLQEHGDNPSTTIKEEQTPKVPGTSTFTRSNTVADDASFGFGRSLTTVESENASVFSEISDITFEHVKPQLSVRKIVDTKGASSQSQEANDYLQLTSYLDEHMQGASENESPSTKKKKLTTIVEQVSKSLIQSSAVSKFKNYINEKKKQLPYSAMNGDDEEKKLDQVSPLNVTQDSISSDSSFECSDTSSSTQDKAFKDFTKKNEMMKKKLQPSPILKKAIDTVKKEKKYQVMITVPAVIGFLLCLVTIIIACVHATSGSWNGLDAFLGYPNRLRKTILRHSPSTSFNRQDSPASLALKWMLNATEVSNSTETLSDSRLLQRFALATLWFSTNGHQWDHRGNWLHPDEHECTWDDPNDLSGKDITCNDDDEVVAIDLDSDRLTGSIPLELGLLTALTKLSAYRNSLTGSLPSQLSTLTQLEELLLFNNQLSGSIPSQLGPNLSNLYWLRLEQNKLTGTIPSTLGSLKELSWLLLSDNVLSGVLPTELAELPNLAWLALDKNRYLHGTFPDAWSSPEIFRLWLQDTHLEGSISVDLCAIPRLHIQPGNLECSCCKSAYL